MALFAGAFWARELPGRGGYVDNVDKLGAWAMWIVQAGRVAAIVDNVGQGF